MSVYLDQNDTWICTDNGLIWYRGSDTLRLKHDEKNEKSLSSDFVYTVFAIEKVIIGWAPVEVACVF